MKRWTLIAATALFPLYAWATNADSIRLEIADLDSRLAFAAGQLERAPAEQAEAIIHDIFFLRRERIDLQEDLVDATEMSESRRDLEYKKISNERQDLERKYEAALEHARRSIKPIIEPDSLSVAEMKRSSSYVTYSLRLDVDNPGPAGKIFVTVKGKRYDGHVLESTVLTEEVDGNSKVTLSGTTMSSVQDAMNIARWEVADVSFYPN